MIVRQKDIGREILYNAGHEGAKDEKGTVSSFTLDCVFVKFRGSRSTAQSCRRANLRWNQWKKLNNITKLLKRILKIDMQGGLNRF